MGLKPISPEQLRAEEKCMRELEMMWSRAFSKEMERQEKQLLKDEPRLAHMSLDEIMKEDEMKRNTCKLCGLICPSWEHLQQHEGLLRCRKREAKNKGETYVPECERPVHCDICDKTVQQRRWSQHVQSQRHKLNIIMKDERAFQCPICDKTFAGKRRKRMLKLHICRVTHLKKLEHPDNRAKHDALVKLYAYDIDTSALIKKCCKIKVI